MGRSLVPAALKDWVCGCVWVWGECPEQDKPRPFKSLLPTPHHLALNPPTPVSMAPSFQQLQPRHRSVWAPGCLFLSSLHPTHQ